MHALPPSRPDLPSPTSSLSVGPHDVLSPDLPEVALWTSADQCPLADRLLGRMAGRINLIAIGAAPPASSAVEQLAHRHHLSPIDDLRLMIQKHPSAYLLLATRTSADPDRLREAMTHKTCLLSLYPIAGTLDAWRRALDVPTDNGGFHLLPDFTQSPGWLSAADPAEVLTDPYSFTMQGQVPRGDGSLLGLTIDAMQCVIRLAGCPQSIDASLTGPKAYLPDGDDAMELTGHWHLHARLTGELSKEKTAGASALWSLTDRAGTYRRRLSVRSPSAQAEIDDIGYRMTDAQDCLLDHAACLTQTPDVAQLAAAQWQRLISVGPSPLNPLDRQRWLEAVACSLTAMLSCRTGQPESPSHLLHMK